LWSGSLYQDDLLPDRSPLPAPEIRIDSVGVNPLDRRRVDVAVDLSSCRQPVEVELVIVGPNDEELSSVLLVQNRESMLDRIMHLRQDAEPGNYWLHIGVFYQKELVAHAARRFTFPPLEPL
jgi:hypothetical protein